MSTLLEQASLVMIPSGYKEDVVYSQIPTDGSGDLSFTRASNGTRINSAGLVEVTPWNLVQYSEDFSNGAWYKSNSVITANDTTAPNGTTTADKYAANGTLTSSFFFISQYVSDAIIGQPYTATLYAKAGTLTQMMMYLGAQNGIYWNLSNGQFISYYNGVQNITAYNSESVGNGWYKYTISINASNTSIPLESYSAKSGNITSNYTTADNYYLWGAQLNIGSTAKPYFPTTDRLNVPRLTYQNGGGGCPSLLLEKQSTNLALYSNALSTSPNIPEGSTATENIYISPDGTQNAIRLTETTLNDIHGFYQYNTVSAQTYTASVWTKQTGRRYISFYSDFTGSATASYFDLQTISVVSSGSGHTCSIQDFGNGWFRLIVTLTATAGSKFVFWGGSNNGSSVSYAGSTSISQTFYGYQLEASSYSTSYIQSTSSSATRVADACSKTGISSLIGQTEGVVFVQGSRFALDSVKSALFAALEKTSTGATMRIQYSQSLNILYADIFDGTSFSAQLSGPFIEVGQTFKAALAYKNNDFAFAVNGSIVATDTSGSVPATDDLKINTSQYNNLDAGLQESQLVLFKTRLSNSDLIALTTL